MTKANAQIISTAGVLSWITTLMAELVRVNGQQAVEFSPCGGFQLETQLNILVNNTCVFRAVRYMEVEEGLWQVHMDQEYYDFLYLYPAQCHVRKTLEPTPASAAPEKEIATNPQGNPLDKVEFLCWPDFLDDPGFRKEHPDWPRAVAELDEVNRLLTLSRKQLVRELFTDYVGKLNRKEIDLSKIVIKKD